MIHFLWIHFNIIPIRIHSHTDFSPHFPIKIHTSFLFMVCKSHYTITITTQDLKFAQQVLLAEDSLLRCYAMLTAKQLPTFCAIIFTVMRSMMKRHVIPLNVGNHTVFTTRHGTMFITALLDVTVLAVKCTARTSGLLNRAVIW